MELRRLQFLAFWARVSFSFFVGALTKKKKRSVLRQTFSLCGCQDSNLERYIDRMCRIHIKKPVVAHPLANGLAHLLTKTPVSRLISIK